MTESKWRSQSYFWQDNERYQLKISSSQEHILPVKDTYSKRLITGVPTTVK